MQSTFTVIRAIGVEFARRILRPLVVIGTIMAIALLALGGWLTTQSAWWWLLEVVFIMGSVVFVLLVIAIYVFLRAVAPPLTKAQRKSVVQFVNKLERVAEHLQTPQIIIIYNILRDTARPQSNTFIETVSKDSKTLAPDFSKLRKDLERS